MTENLIKISIDSIEIQAVKGSSSIQACKSIGLIIPRFCYHETLNVAGNCRMCLIEIDNIEKPIASCATEVKDGMELFTNNAFIKKARENVLETLLLNHPIDCPICDQAGECDLQDQAKIYGGSHSRYFFQKKTVEDKICNPLIKTIMTRCITCTRCVRYSSEISGVDYFGTLSRGNKTEISSYVSKMFHSEISANVVDLCPVGALTSSTFAFQARPWELRMAESIDINDSLGSNLIINYKENYIVRILPKINNEINDNIISDIARYSSEYAQYNRIVKPSFNYDYEAKKQKEKAFNLTTKLVNNKIQTKESVNLYVDETLDLVPLIYLSQIYKTSPKFLNVVNITQSDTIQTNLRFNEKYLVNQILNNLNDGCLLVGVNLRLENTILNAKLRTIFRTTFSQILTTGFNYKNNLPNKLLFLNIDNILGTFLGINDNEFYDFFIKKNNLIIFGKNIFNRVLQSFLLISYIKKMVPAIKIIKLLNSINSELVKVLLFNNVNNKFIFKSSIFFNLDDNVFTRKLISKVDKNYEISVFVNTNGSDLSQKFENIIPIKSHLESDSLYLTLGYFLQKSFKSIELQSEIPIVADVLKMFFFRPIKNIKYEYIASLLVFVALTKMFTMKSLKITEGRIKNILSYIYNAIKESIRNYYNYNKFGKNSKTLVETSELFIKSFLNLIYYVFKNETQLIYE